MFTYGKCRSGPMGGAGMGLAVIGLLMAGSAEAASAVPGKGPSYQVLYSFTGGTDGSQPQANLINDVDGNLYGTTIAGGSANYGVVFEIAPDGAESVLHSFSSSSDGEMPGFGSLVRDSAGSLYGTTQYGGTSANGGGEVFKLAPDGTKTALYSFCPGGYPCVDGDEPGAGVIRDGKGNLYGTTVLGGASDQGAVYKIAPDGTETVLYSFTGGNDGANPFGDLLEVAGNFYGTALVGGADGNGTAFELMKGKKGAYTFKLLYTFTGGADGGAPAGDLTADSAGNLYGTTSFGGNSGFGVVYKLTPDGAESVLYSFTGGSDGGSPYTGLLLKKGTLYGMTYLGGIYNFGTVFALAPDGTESVLHSFAGGNDGECPVGASHMNAGKGYLYGTTTQGGTSNNGVVFKVKY